MASRAAASWSYSARASAAIRCASCRAASAAAVSIDSCAAGAGGICTSRAASRESSTEGSGLLADPCIAVTGAPKASDSPLASAANFSLSTWLIAKSTTKSTSSSVIMSA